MGFSFYSIFVFLSSIIFNREVLIVIMSKWQMSIDKFMLFFRPLPLSTLPCSAWWSISWSWSWLRQLPWWRQWYDDNLMMMATIGSTCMMAVRKPGSHTEIGMLKSAVVGFPNWHVSGCHFQEQVGWGTWLVCCPSFQLAVIIMMIILNMTLMALLQKDIRITCWPSSIAFDADDNDVIQTWEENCIWWLRYMVT